MQMMVNIADATGERQDELLQKLRRNSKQSSDVYVVIYLNAGDESEAQSAAVAKIVDELKKRITGSGGDDTKLAIADLRMDCDRHEVTRGGMLIHLSPMEYSLLEYLLLHRDRVQTEMVLMDSVFGGAPKGSRFNTLWVHMHRLRKKIDIRGSARLIHTIRGVGYILKTPTGAESKALSA